MADDYIRQQQVLALKVLNDEVKRLRAEADSRPFSSDDVMLALDILDAAFVHTGVHAGEEYSRERKQAMLAKIAAFCSNAYTDGAARALLSPALEEVIRGWARWAYDDQ